MSFALYCLCLKLQEFGGNIWYYAVKHIQLKGATGLYKPVGGAGANFCMILNMLHIRDPFFKIKKHLQTI